MIYNKKKWKFNDAQNVAVITTKDIIFEGKDILYVFHDLDDGMWQFLSHLYPSKDEAAIVGLNEICKIDNSVEELVDLPLGYYAYRKTKKDKWIKEKNFEQFEQS